jgi:hypothetical protein
VPDFATDMARVSEILERDFTDRFADPARRGHDHRPILSQQRSIGSVIKLLTPSPEFSADYNEWLASLPAHVVELVYVVKRYYRPEWGADWASHFSVAMINGRAGNALRLDGEPITVAMLRVGFAEDGAWRLFGLRHDFHPAAKVQTEDDITASTVVPGPQIGLDPTWSAKVVINCEELLFQRPDDAIIRGYDTQTEKDMAASDVFLSNFQPLTRADARAMVDDAVAFSQFSAPMADKLRAFASGEDGPEFAVSSANPRLVGGKPSKNPRYLQRRPDRTNVTATAAANLSCHLVRKLPCSQPLVTPVDIVAAGRRNNPPEPGVPALCVYNPLHFMELPELLMEFISSMTGKSPSTTGAGSEGAMTKGPFNAMPAVFDLNQALLAYALTGDDGWISSAGYIGPKCRVDHDISLLIPEVFSRMKPDERASSHLIREGSLEKIDDFEYQGRTVPASRLGYRITAKFMSEYFGRVFLHPDVIFTPEMLRPELQSLPIFVDSMDVIVATHQRCAQAYLDDGTISYAVPPLRALLQIMATGSSDEGWTLDSPDFRASFTRDSILESDWYAARLDAKQLAAIQRSTTGLEAVERFAAAPGNQEPSARLDLAARIAEARAFLQRVSSAEYREGLVGTIGGQVM